MVGNKWYAMNAMNAMRWMQCYEYDVIIVMRWMQCDGLNLLNDAYKVMNSTQ